MALQHECMSPEQSEAEANTEDSDEESDEGEQCRAPRNRLLVRPLSWRSDKLNEIFAMLDQKWK